MHGAIFQQRLRFWCRIDGGVDLQSKAADCLIDWHKVPFLGLF
jgi:hypothetical protein